MRVLSWTKEISQRSTMKSNNKKDNIEKYSRIINNDNNNNDEIKKRKMDKNTILQLFYTYYFYLLRFWEVKQNKIEVLRV